MTLLSPQDDHKLTLDELSAKYSVDLTMVSKNCLKEAEVLTDLRPQTQICTSFTLSPAKFRKTLLGKDDHNNYPREKLRVDRMVRVCFCLSSGPVYILRIYQGLQRALLR